MTEFFVIVNFFMTRQKFIVIYQWICSYLSVKFKAWNISREYANDHYYHNSDHTLHVEFMFILFICFVIFSVLFLASWKIFVFKFPGNIKTSLGILTGKKHPKIKLHCLQKIRIWTFESLVHQINSFQEVPKLKQIFQKSKTVTGKTPLFLFGQFCSRHSLCLNIGFWQSSFEWKWCAFNLSGFN